MPAPKYAYWVRGYYEAHPEKLDRLREQQRKWRRNYRFKLMNLLGGKKCTRCGFHDARALRIDFIYGGGTRELKNGNYYVYRYYLHHPNEAIEKLQVLCVNCDCIKRYERGEFNWSGRGGRGPSNHAKKGQYDNECQQRWRDRTRLKLIELLGPKCVRCGFTDARVLHIDYIGGGGAREMKSRGGNIQLYSFYLHHPEDAKERLQVLCGNCNWIKRHQRGEVNWGGRRKETTIPIQSYD